MGCCEMVQGRDIRYGQPNSVRSRAEKASPQSTVSSTFFSKVSGFSETQRWGKAFAG